MKITKGVKQIMTPDNINDKPLTTEELEELTEAAVNMLEDWDYVYDSDDVLEQIIIIAENEDADPLENYYKILDLLWSWQLILD